MRVVVSTTSFEELKETITKQINQKIKTKTNP